VELSGVGGLPVHFARDSSWNNMRFAAASTFESPAIISLAGVPPIGPAGAPREVYIFVKTTNMPAEVVGKDREGLPRGSLERERAAARAYRYPRVGDFMPNRPAGAVGRAGAGGNAGANAAAQAGGGAGGAPPIVESDRDLHEQLRATRPTYEVHTYFDSGKVSPQGSGQFKLLRPLIPFGYFVYHEGPLAGWLSKLEAEGGYVLQEIAPGLYRATIPEGGAIKVKTTIIARGPNDPVPPVDRGHRCSCDIVRPRSGGFLELAAGLTLLGVLAARSRRSRRRSSDY
jgi:hypothetical protein